MSENKTETIEVPHFEGYKCLGCVTPEGGHHILSLNRDKLFMVGGIDARAVVVYEKLPPKRYIFEETGEYRRAEHGEWFFSATNNPCRWLEVYPTPYKFKILRKVDE